MIGEEYQFHVVECGVDDDESALRELIHADASINDLTSGMSPMLLCIRGYDEDPRELWEVPEVRALCRRLVRMGFIAILHQNAVRDRTKEVNLPNMAWDSMMVYYVATNDNPTSRPVIESTPFMHVFLESMLLLGFGMNREMKVALAQFKRKYGNALDQFIDEV